MNEIEKKFIVYNLPIYIKKNLIKTHTLKQNYIDLKIIKLRLRKYINANNQLLTIKFGKGLVRKELELNISNKIYKLLSNLTNKKPIIKKREVYKLNDNYLIECDIFIKPNKNYYLCEIEFSSKTEANNFTTPNWLKNEVTGIDKYTNEYIWIDYNS